MNKKPTKKAYTTKDLYPNYKVTCYLEKDEGGMPALVNKNNDGTIGSTCKK